MKKKLLLSAAVITVTMLTGVSVFALQQNVQGKGGESPTAKIDAKPVAKGSIVNNDQPETVTIPTTNTNQSNIVNPSAISQNPTPAPVVSQPAQPVNSTPVATESPVIDETTTPPEPTPSGHGNGTISN